ncbi:MAG TPA: CvpA family protein [Steroidobacteraceae bacterium]|nr:CvpA family protein [Steroidobacteraceae bacterium]
MNTVDYLVIALVIICAAVGLLRGFLREAIALVTWIIAVTIAWHFAGSLVPALGGALALPQVAPWASRAILTCLMLLLGAAVAAAVSAFVRLSLFSGMDRFLGFVVGLLRGVVILGVLVLFCQMMRLDGERWWHRSMLIRYGEDVAAALHALVGDSSPTPVRAVDVETSQPLKR